MKVQHPNNSDGTVYREIDGMHVVWFGNGNQFLRLEEPAYWVFESNEKGLSRETMITQCAERYQNPSEVSRVFVTDVLEGIEAVKNWASLSVFDCSNDDLLRIKQFTPFSIRNYAINGKLLRFHFETRRYEYFLHPLLQHLEAEASSSEPILFELFGDNGKVVLRVNQQVKGAWREDESHLINGMASLQLLNAAYEKTDQDWMAIIHASAVTNGAKTIVFTASPGSGKSTIAAMLQKNGYSLVSDDFVALERLTQHVFPFPAAMSVKEGAAGLLSAWYPALQNQDAPQKSRTNKLVRYLPVDGKAIPAPVKEIIFIKFDPDVDFEMEKLPRTEALKMLMDETWTSPSTENAGRFLDWYSGVSCYRLTYSNNGKAIQTITGLFEQ